MKRILVFFIIIFFGVLGLKAQVSFQAVPQKREAGLNEPIRIQFMLTIKSKKSQNSVSNIKLPSFTNSRVVGRDVIQKQDYEGDEVVVLYGEEITLRAVKSGKIKIGSASIVVNGRTHMTKPLTIIITDDNLEPSDEKANLTEMGDAFLTFKVSDKSPYQNEGITAQLKFYTKRVELLNTLTNLAAPNFQGLYVQPIKQRNNTYEQEIINGEVYLSRVINSYVIFPSKSGITTINPFTLTLTVPNGFFEDHEIYVKSAPITLQVKKIPENAPKDFYGVVGNYKMRAVTNKEILKTQEAATVTVEISGRGNMGLVKIPELIIPEGIEQFTPKNRMDLAPTLEGGLGKVSNSTVLVPHKSGKYDIKIKSFSYFDPKEGEFKTLSENPIVLTVAEDSIIEKNNAYPQGIRDSNKMSYIPNFNVKETISDVLEGKKKKSNKTFIILSTITGLLLVGGIYFVFIRKKRSDKEEVEENSKKEIKHDKFKILAGEPTNKKDFTPDLFQLKKIAEKGEDKMSFYSLAESILQGAINQNLDISYKQFVTSADIEEKLVNKFGDEFADECKNMLLKSQIERYSNVSDQDSLHSVYFKIEELVKKLN